MIADAGWLLAELLVLFLAVSFVIHLVQRRFGPERVKRWMGGSPVTAALKGIAVGFVTPFCTYSAIPMLVGLRQAGVPTAGYVAFVSAAPVLDPVLFGALVIIVGLPAASLYTAVAFVGALSLALVAQRFGAELSLDGLDSTDRPAGGCSTATATATATAGPGPVWLRHRPRRPVAARQATPPGSICRLRSGERPGLRWRSCGPSAHCSWSGC